MMIGKTLVGLTAASMLVAGPAFASTTVEDELAEMRQLVEGLKDRVEAQEEQIEHQGGLLEDAQRVVRETQEEDGTASGLSEYWEAVDVSLSVATSYAYNFHNPNGNPGGVDPGNFVNQGQSGLFYPFHGDHNSFQVDQALFGIGKESTEESRAGFGFTLFYGQTATFLGQGSPAGAYPIDSTSDYYVHEAYVTYLAPIGEGFHVKAGKFATIIGAEVADASANFNITRGNIYNLFQPIDHVGVLGTTTLGPISFGGGVVNQGSLVESSSDHNKEKSYLGTIGFSADAFSAAVNVLYGAEGGNGFHQSAVPGGNSKREGLVDFLASFESDGFEAWVNADYVWTEGASPQGWGVAVAGRVPLTDLLSAALRLEYARDDGNIPLLGLANNATRHSEIYGATGTLAYLLAENLTLKGEVRYDRVKNDDLGGPEQFLTNTGNGDNDQVVGMGQLIYAF